MSYKITASDIGNLRLNETDPVTSILQNVLIILNTWQGTVPLYRDFGVSNTPLHTPVTVAKPMFFARIQEAVEKYEPRVSVVGISFEENPDVLGGLVPTVEVEIKNE